jgi:hypothetical protein
MMKRALRWGVASSLSEIQNSTFKIQLCLRVPPTAVVCHPAFKIAPLRGAMLVTAAPVFSKLANARPAFKI